jgi:hypothetical protein
MLSISFLTFALFAPVPHKVEQEEYYPTKVGSKFVYATPNGESVHVVMDVEENDGAKLVTIGTIRGDKLVPWDQVRVSEKGLAQIGSYPVTVQFDGVPSREPKWHQNETPIVLLDLTAKAGDKWEHRTPERLLTYTAGKAEKIKVPAGEFQARRVDITRTFPDGRKDQFCWWYAPRVGAVKWTYGKEEVVLKSITFDEE